MVITIMMMRIRNFVGIYKKTGMKEGATMLKRIIGFYGRQMQRCHAVCDPFYGHPSSGVCVCKTIKPNYEIILRPLI